MKVATKKRIYEPTDYVAIDRRDGKWYIRSQNFGRTLAGPYASKARAELELRRTK